MAETEEMTPGKRETQVLVIWTIGGYDKNGKILTIGGYHRVPASKISEETGDSS